MAKAHTYVNFPGNTEEAFEFYRSIFGGEFQSVVRFGDMPDPEGRTSAEHRDKIMHIGLKIGPDSLLMGTDSIESAGFSKLNMGNNSYIYLEADSAQEAERLFDDLSAGGRKEMELQSTAWAEKYGSLVDKFGLQWMINYTGNVHAG